MSKRYINWNKSKKRGEPSTSATVGVIGKTYGSINRTEAGEWQAWAPGPMVDRGGVSINIIRRPNGRQFAYVGDYTLTALDDFGGRWVVTRDIDGDEVVVAAGLTLDEAIATAEAEAVTA